ncbi:hypothetical protein JIN84_19280 [Luteolibacter yonseiensis]|uniref:Uncharacterized protein n=1 Tax=Luteolibacter yonseiensis TaxID=1144680 RepID=A0A934R7U6_9BACT|nr:hypothetical protein [Luteolibacter yonseiensis]MBK1817771.1 hypothetical protein [Luteolibacter yonseiensis]
MRKSISLPVLACAGFITGYWSGDHLTTLSGIASKPALLPSASARPNEQTPHHLTEPPQEKHNLAALLRWRSQRADGDPGIRNEIGRMDSSTIREMMTGVLAAQQDGPMEVRLILDAAAKELFHREGEKALEWADSLDPASGRRAILEHVVVAAVSASPEMGKQWIDRYEKEFGKDRFSPFPSAAATGATRRGAADLLQLRIIMGTGSTAPMGPIPNDFDFHLLITESPNLASLGQAMEYWTAKDRENAWAAVREIMVKDANKGVNFFGSAFTGIASIEGERQAARWISGKLDELPPDLRERAVSSLLTNELTQNATYETLMAEFPHDADRVALAASIVNPFANPTAGSNVLKSLGSESLQVQALVRSAKTFSRVASDPDDPSARDIHTYFGKTMDQLDLGPASREKVDTVLNTPQDPDPR